MPLKINPTQRKLIFWTLTALTVGLGVFAAFWMIASFQEKSAVLVFGQTVPQWLLPVFVIYLAARNLSRLWKMRQPLLEGDGNFDLSGTLLGKLLGQDKPPTTPQPNRAQRRANRKK